MVTCVSCNRNVRNDRKATRFACPNCGKAEMIRCGECRHNAIAYVCSACEFAGP